ncbi:MAG: hypothetical protein KQH57_12060 [Actinomycetales bacterium]|nr:hypothetical protein [Actinomycetales bacterium]
MRAMLRLAGPAIAAALVLATSSVAAADEPTTAPEPAASSGSDVTTGCEEATPGATAADPADPADPMVPDEQTDQTVPDEQTDQTVPDEQTDQELADPCADSADDPAGQLADEPVAEPTDGAMDEADPEATAEPSEADPDPTAEPIAEPSEADPEATAEPSEADPDPTAEPSEADPDPTTEPTDQPSGDPAGAPADELTSDPGREQVVGPADPVADPVLELPAQPTTDLAAPAPDLAPSAPSTSRAPGGPVASAPTSGALHAAATTMTPLAVLTTMPAGPSPLTVPFATVDAFPAYDPQVFCDPTPKPGTEYLARLAISYFGAGHLSGISRDCSVGPTSEHKEGRAFDWALSVDVPEEKAAGDAFAQWLTAVGPDGKVGYNARRLGVMYIIWNEQIWLNSDANASWHAYWGPSPHTDHVHVSLTWAGAYEHTSWWTGDPIPDRAELARLAGEAWARVFGHEPDAALLAAWISRLADRGSLPLTGAGLARLAVVFAVVLDAGRWGLDRPAPEPGDGEWVITVGRSVI